MHPWSGELYAHTGTLQQQADLKSYKLTSLAPLLCSLKAEWEAKKVERKKKRAERKAERETWSPEKKAPGSLGIGSIH